MIKEIAMLCSVIAGDDTTYRIKMDHSINRIQMECHSFYAKCTKTKDLKYCMSKRYDVFLAAEKKQKSLGN